MEFTISLLHGDYADKDVCNSATSILTYIAKKYNHTFKYIHPPFGINAVDKTGVPMPQETLDACVKSNAILYCVPTVQKWTEKLGLDVSNKALRQLRLHLKANIGMTPIAFHTGLENFSPLKNIYANKDSNIIFIMDELGGIYSGSSGIREGANNILQAYDTEVISVSEIEKITVATFELAKLKQTHITNIDTADKTESGRLWRKIVKKTSKAYPDIKVFFFTATEGVRAFQSLENLGIVLSQNTIGELLLSMAVANTGAPTTIACASIGHQSTAMYGPYWYENNNNSYTSDSVDPTGTLLAVALMLSNSFGLIKEAANLTKAISQTIATNRSIAMGGVIGTKKMTELILQHM